MHTVRTILIIVAVLLLSLSPISAQDKKIAGNDPDEPVAKKASLRKAVSFLDDVSLQWTRKRQCGTCHTNYAYMIARPSAKEIPSKAMVEVRKFFESRVANWDTKKPRWDTEVVATAVTMAFYDAQTTGKLHPLTRQALDKMWTLQKKHGAWSWIKCDWPPMEHDDYFGALYAALGVGVAPDDYADTPAAKAGLAKLKQYFRDTPAPDLHHRALLMWASMRMPDLMSDKERQETIAKLFKIQRPDGGWNLPSLGNWKRHNGSVNDDDTPSDGYGTGMVVYVLRQVGIPAKDERIQKAVQWLKQNQRVSGRWFTRSLSTDRYHYISHAGTAYALMALRACGEKLN